MKTGYTLFLFVFMATSLLAQSAIAVNNSGVINQNTQPRYTDNVKELSRYSDLLPSQRYSPLADTIKTQTTDSLKYNMYGGLRNDDPLYIKKASIGMVVFRLTLANVTTFLIDRYIFNYEFSRVGIKTIKNNFQKGWEWDVDRFAMNYFFHPYSGSMYFNAARANGYSFFESAPFAVLGSLEWEYFAENTLPAYNDIINTPINGIFLGEIFYRLGSNILDDQTTGTERFFREMAVAFLTPTRFFSRLLSGDISRLTATDVFQKEPLNVTLAAGYHKINEGKKIEKGYSSFNFTFHLDYGNPFEKRSRKPFDFFKVRTDFDFGAGRKIISLITGYGLLYGKNVQIGNTELLVGLFQHMNFFDNKTFELGSIGFGPGLASKLLVGKNSSLYTNLHVALIPFGALSNRFGPDTTQVRDYNYTYGAETKLEANYNFNSWVGIAFIGYYWWMHSIAGIEGNVTGNSYVGLIKPRITVKVFNNFSIGFEHLIYYSDRYPRDFASVHSVRTEQRLFLQLFLEEFKFKK